MNSALIREAPRSGRLDIRLLGDLRIGVDGAQQRYAREL
jgi:hypothetical protein